MKNIFYNKEEKKIRSGWIILIFMLLFLTLNIALITGVRKVLGSLSGIGTLWFLLLISAGTTAIYNYQVLK